MNGPSLNAAPGGSTEKTFDRGVMPFPTSGAKNVEGSTITIILAALT
jgi:hypothetical protein